MIDKKKAYIVLYVIFIVGCFILWSKSIRVLYVNMQNTKEMSNTEIKGTLVEAIFRNAHEKTKYISSSNLEKAVIYIEKLFQPIDTTFLHQSKTLDPVTMLFHNMQVFVLHMDSLHIEGVRNHFDSLLNEKQIKAEIAVKAISTGNIKNITAYSGDTTSMVIDGRAEYIMNNEYGEIKYIVYLDYILDKSMLVLFKHTLTSIIISAISLGGIIILLLKSRMSLKRNCNSEIKMREKIIKSKTGIFLSDEELKIEGKQIFFKGKSLRIAPQSLQILQLFLVAEQHLVNKEELKKIWIYNHDSISGMTSAINRLNRYLAEIGCSYIIVTDKLNKGFYKFDSK